jgi:hypothetical protein
MSQGLYLYGIFPLPGPVHLNLKGLDNQPVQTHRMNEFVFLYSEAQQKPYLASRRNLLGHEQVLEQAMDEGYRTLLPLRFGIVITDWNTVKQELVDPYRANMVRLFSKLSGQREVSIKVFWDQRRELDTLVSENDSLRAERDRLEGKVLGMDEVVRIGQAIEQAMSDRRANIISIFQSALNSLALEIVENDVLADAMIYNAAYLIPWDSESRFSSQIEALDYQFDERLRIRYNNFTAPFNFAHID